MTASCTWVGIGSASRGSSSSSSSSPSLWRRCPRIAVRQSLQSSGQPPILHLRWCLETDGLELLPLPIKDAGSLALLAGSEMLRIPRRWCPIKNGDDGRGRCQCYLRMRDGARAPMSNRAAQVLDASQQLVHERLGQSVVLNDVVMIADLQADLSRQKLHRDIRKDNANSSTHGLLVPLAHEARLHVVFGSHKPRQHLRSRFSVGEVSTINVPVGSALLWDGMLVHAGDGGVPGSQGPSRPRLHCYVENPEEPRLFDDEGDRGIKELP